jgi:hypothetical protein
MSDRSTQKWPVEKIRRRLRPDEALIEMVRAERVYLASRRQTQASNTRQTMLSRNQPWTEEEEQRLRALVAQGASVVKAAAVLKRKIVSVRTRARGLGCPFPPLRVARQKWADTQDNV